ncbi:MAG TPA: class I SAM-dependent methyltransferase, partial [Gemmatimonadales bacterium]|nr:class I SAM-dependent methyltransferase [Gemmatimonadales bacterium]
GDSGRGNFVNPPTASRQSAQLFDETAVHEESGAHRTESEQARIKATAALVPPETRTLLDVGCGRGDLLHAIDVPFSVGTDLARRGIRYVRRPATVSSMLSLPFRDRSFDVVLCAETLEHLDPADLVRATAELRRIARKSLVITVPYQEDLLAWSTQCPRCGTLFHLHGHRNVFSPERLKGLFPGASDYAVQGTWPVRPMSPVLLRFRTEKLGLWKFGRFAHCPECGNEAFDNQERRLLYKGVDLLNSMLHPRRSNYRWLLLRVDL